MGRDNIDIMMKMLSCVCYLIFFKLVLMLKLFELFASLKSGFKNKLYCSACRFFGKTINHATFWVP